MKGYGLTESAAGVARTAGPEETGSRPGTTGRLNGCVEAKIVEPNTGEAMTPGGQGELWLRGPFIMKGKFALKKVFCNNTCYGFINVWNILYRLYW